MNKNLACLLATVFPLLSGCVDAVPLADRSDAGPRDVPSTDVPVSPYTDVPPMDAPATGVCAACGGVSGIDCLYAPGCGAVVRVCAPNTCGDAVAIGHCGCDGVTFFSGCLTPDRPFRHTGPCERVADSGPLDASDVPPVAPYCPAELDQNTAQNPDLRYPRAVVRSPPDTGAVFPTGASYEVRGRWLAPRRLATPVDMNCVASVATDAACHPDGVIRVQPEGDAGSPVEFVTSVAFDALPAVATGTAVVLRLQPTIDSLPDLTPSNVVLTLQRASDDALLMVVANTYRDPSLGAVPFTYRGLGVLRSADPACISRPEPSCRRTFGAFSMELSGVTGGRAIQPRESAVFNGAGGRFSFRNLLLKNRLPRVGAECADLPYDIYAFEIVRQPDL